MASITVIDARASHRCAAQIRRRFAQDRTTSHNGIGWLCFAHRLLAKWSRRIARSQGVFVSVDVQA